MINPGLIYDRLFDRYGDLNWWPADNPYQVMVGAILTQNTAWSNVELAIANFGGKLSPEFIEMLPLDELKEFIRPAGFFNQKAVYLKALTEWFARYDYNVAKAAERPLSDIRKELLAVRGVGRETADSILLYALGLPSFVVDNYTMRLLGRLNIPIELEYEKVKAYFEESIPAEKFNNLHAMIVINAKDYCRKKPGCDNCPLGNLCKPQETLTKERGSYA